MIKGVEVILNDGEWPCPGAACPCNGPVQLGGTIQIVIGIIHDIGFRCHGYGSVDCIVGKTFNPVAIFCFTGEGNQVLAEHQGSP